MYGYAMDSRTRESCCCTIFQYIRRNQKNFFGSFYLRKGSFLAMLSKRRLGQLWLQNIQRPTGYIAEPDSRLGHRLLLTAVKIHAGRRVPVDLHLPQGRGNKD